MQLFGPGKSAFIWHALFQSWFNWSVGQRLGCMVRGAGETKKTRPLPSYSLSRTLRRAFSVIEDLREDFLCSLILSGCKKLFRRRLLNDLTSVHEDHPIGNTARKPHLMGHANHRHAVGGK